MGREPRAFTVWCRITQGEERHFLVVITAMATDDLGPREVLGETAEAPTLEEAQRLRLEMCRAFCARLEAQGNRVANLELLD